MTRACDVQNGLDPLHVCLCTPLPGFGNELCDVMKLFYTVEEFVICTEGTIEAEENAGNQENTELLRHCFTSCVEGWMVSFAFRGREVSRSMPLPVNVEEDRQPIVYKRLQKRLCKLALYDLLKQLTGGHPPWGSLTGIRPTRLMYESLARGCTMSQAVTALHEEFDVKPQKAMLLQRIIEVQQTLPPSGEKEVDLYISIPFCRTRCAYCSFPGETVGGQLRTDAYLAALFEEMRQMHVLMQRQGFVLRAVYIGGGTPTALSEEGCARLMQEAARLFPGAREFTVEAGRPDTITREKLHILRELGVSRISINPQTMNNKTLQLVGRQHTAEEVREAFLLARGMGFQSINMDVIAALPGEAEVDFAYTMKEIVALKPDSLTVHTLAIKRSSRLNLQNAILPDGSLAARMVEMGEDAARDMGMQPYYLYRQKYMAGQQQNVGYAKPGAACLYNVDIMEENTSIIAVGAGAISKRVFVDRELRIERAPNVSNVDVYIQRVQEMVERKKRLWQ